MGNVHKRNEDVYEIIAANIKAQRKKINITQAELADRTQYSHEYIRRIEAPNGKKYFSIDTLVHIANALKVKPEQLLKGVSSGDD